MMAEGKLSFCSSWDKDNTEEIRREYEKSVQDNMESNYVVYEK